MIILITARGHGGTLKSFTDGTFGVPTPNIRLTTYERMFGAWDLPRATYIFSDIERLTHWELRLAAALYRNMKLVGLRCLNDPARVMARIELLNALHAAGVNPFAAYRADENPQPKRFPVFIRSEADHLKAKADLFHSQEDLDRALMERRERGRPLRGWIVIEQAAEPYGDGLWAKWGTWRIGEQMIVEHIALDVTWLVKTGVQTKVVGHAAEDEHDAVVTNRYAEDLRRAFEIGHIEFGRADHATVGGRVVVYEINTNPYIGYYSPAKLELRRKTQLASRTKLADAFAAIDTKEKGRVKMPGPMLLSRMRWWWPEFLAPTRP
jgi:hypothetical protein